VERFAPSRSQRRVLKRCNDLFTVECHRPVLDDEHLELYARYQENQHGLDGQTTDEDSYERFLLETIADTWELSWRDASGTLVAVGILDAVPNGLSTVYFYWDPALRDLSVGVFSALYEIDLCRRWGKRYYYLGYLVAGAKTMSYKASFAGGEVWSGSSWIPVPGRDVDDPATRATLDEAERASIAADNINFRLD
jgi:arginine-tRNA-protein transferase